MIGDLRLQHFRSYSEESFELDPGVNIVVGPNASGKTNLLEAVLVLALGSSYRAKDHELVQFEEPWARLDANLAGGVSRTVKIINEPKPSKEFDIGGKKLRRLHMEDSIPAVLFEPNHLQLLSGGPERRRNYLDDLLEQTNPTYGTTRRQYKRALAQRNSLLKQINYSNQTQIFPWNVRLSQLGGQIARSRFELLEKFQDQLAGLYKDISHTNTKVDIFYDCQWQTDTYETNLLKKLEATIDLDGQRGFTGNGPHRDDVAVFFDERPAEEVASRGEARTAILAMKIIELKIIENVRQSAPLLLLDDVFSELDGSRRHALTDYLADYQTFITTTDADLVVQSFTGKSNIIPLAKR